MESTSNGTVVKLKDFPLTCEDSNPVFRVRHDKTTNSLCIDLVVEGEIVHDAILLQPMKDRLRVKMSKCIFEEEKQPPPTFMHDHCLILNKKKYRKKTK